MTGTRTRFVTPLQKNLPLSAYGPSAVRGDGRNMLRPYG